jgi:hypothetical protein
MLRIIAIAVLLIGAAFVVGSFFISPSSQKCISNAEQYQGTEPQKERSAHFFVSTIPRCIGEFLEANNAVVTAIATAIIAIFTVMLVVVTDRQAKLTRRSADIAERALTELEAPFLGLKVTEPGFGAAWISKDRCRITKTYNGLTFCFVNYGRTPAVLLELHDRLQICGKGEMPDLEWKPAERGKPYPYGVLIGPDKPSADSFRLFEDFIKKEEFESFEKEESDFFLVGRLRYRDIFNRISEMGFCAMFDRATSGFVMEGNERYNYCRRA